MTPGVRSLTASLALVMVAGGYVWMQSRVERPAPPRPQRITSRAEPPVPLVTASAALTAGIALSSRQRAELQRMAADWDGERASFDSAVTSAARQFELVMAEARPSGRTTISDLQRGSESIRELSADLHRRRLRHRKDVLSVLDEAQRADLERIATAPAVGGRGERR
jgi:hypothetical protein